MEFHRAASKHGVQHDDVLHAVEHALAVVDVGDDLAPYRTLVLGPDHSGNMLEVVVLHFDDGRDMVIHAMPMRTLYQPLLPNHGDPT